MYLQCTQAQPEMHCGAASEGIFVIVRVKKNGNARGLFTCESFHESAAEAVPDLLTTF